jgi:adenylate cyclase
MALEIERKYLVKNDDFKKESFKKVHIIQGFLSSVPERTVRIRVVEDKGFITVK